MTDLGALLRALRTSRTMTVRARPGNWLSALVTRPLSQNELARRACVDTAYVHAIERGDRRHPSRAVVLRLAEALGLGRLDTARLLVAAGFWPVDGLSDDATDAALRVLLAAAAGDRRRADEPARQDAGAVVR